MKELYNTEFKKLEEKVENIVKETFCKSLFDRITFEKDAIVINKKIKITQAKRWQPPQPSFIDYLKCVVLDKYLIEIYDVDLFNIFTDIIENKEYVNNCKEIQETISLLEEKW